MKTIKLHQEQDTLKQQNLAVNQYHKDSILGIELLEEIDDEQVILPKKKHHYHHVNVKQAKQKHTTNDTAFYGISNPYQLPIRHIKPKIDTVLAPKILLTPTLRNVSISSWQIVLLIIGILFVGLAKAFNTNRFKQISKAFFSYQTASEIIREEKAINHRVNILLSSTFLLSISLFIYQIMTLAKINLSNMEVVFYLKILAFLIAIYVVKYLFSYILAFVFKQQTLFFEYVFNISLFNNLLGLMLIPTILVLYFSHINNTVLVNYIAIPIFILVFILRVLRLLKIAKTKNISYFYIFLYICTLEILPLVVMIKIFIL